MILKAKDNGYLVYSGDEIVGFVQIHSAWTVRGSHKTWEAYRNGRRVQGGFETRRDAATFLVNR